MLDTVPVPDLRKRPDDAAHVPVKHEVRIVVVVPNADDAQPSPEDQRHGLSDDDLISAGNFLHENLAPPSPSVSGQRKTLFNELKPTDIVVMRGEPASLRGKGPARRLFTHDGGHRDTVLRVWTGSDTIEYHCDQPFTIVKVEKAGWKLHGTPAHPFDREPPYEAVKGDAHFTWTSSVLTRAANNQQYKMSFKIGDQLVDPDLVCGNPPPEP